MLIMDYCSDHQLVPKPILQEAAEIVEGPRAESYGDPRVMGERIGKIWGAILNCEVTPEQVQLCMIGLKVARECNKPGRDNLVDIAGYAQVLDKVINDVKVDPDVKRVDVVRCDNCGVQNYSHALNCTNCEKVLGV